MGKKVDAAMAELSPYKLKTNPKVCATCGQKYIPTGRGQKYCQACKARMTQEELHAKRIAKAKDAAFGPGPWSIPASPAAGNDQGPDADDGKSERHFYYKVSIKKDEEKMLDGIIREDMLQKIMEAIR